MNAREADSIARRHTRGRFFLCVMAREGESDALIRTMYKSLGYRLPFTEAFFAHRCRDPKSQAPGSIERVRTPGLAVQLGKVTRTRPLLSDLLGDKAPFRQYVALDGEEIVGRVRSVDAAGATWRANMYVSPSRPGSRFHGIICPYGANCSTYNIFNDHIFGRGRGALSEQYTEPDSEPPDVATNTQSRFRQ
jgi:hypothetical protein